MLAVQVWYMLQIFLSSLATEEMGDGRGEKQRCDFRHGRDFWLLLLAEFLNCGEVTPWLSLVNGTTP
jgi:hypothetical protein